MPARNALKQYVDEGVYHIYNRGVNKEEIFRDHADYGVFLGMLKRLLGPQIEKDKKGEPYLNFYLRIELNSYCLMPNHFHLMIYQHNSSDMESFMRSLCTSYSKYFNKKYNRVGHMFQGRYQAVLVGNENYFKYLSKYIHLNPLRWSEWEFSSIHNYLGSRVNEWVFPSRVLEAFDSIDSYKKFLSDDIYPLRFAEECTAEDSPAN